MIFRQMLLTSSIRNCMQNSKENMHFYVTIYRDKTIIPLVVVGCEVNRSNSALRSSLIMYLRVSKVRYARGTNFNQWLCRDF